MKGNQRDSGQGCIRLLSLAPSQQDVTQPLQPDPLLIPTSLARQPRHDGLCPVRLGGGLPIGIRSADTPGVAGALPFWRGFSSRASEKTHGQTLGCPLEMGHAQIALSR